MLECRPVEVVVAAGTSATRKIPAVEASATRTLVLEAVAEVVEASEAPEARRPVPVAEVVGKSAIRMPVEGEVLVTSAARTPAMASVVRAFQKSATAGKSEK